MSKFLRVDFEIQQWGCARVDGIDMIASLSVHEVRSLSGGIGDVVAVSHVWGNAQCLVENVEGASHGIKISSPRKMERLLNIAKSKGWKKLWLDNICINQEDKKEKAREVMRMGSVYRKTRATLILLDSTRSELLRETIPRILSSQEDTNVALFGGIDDMELLAGKFIELAQDEWYERLWTVQESALATRMYMAPSDEDIPYDVSGLRHSLKFWLMLLRFMSYHYADKDSLDSNDYLLQNFCKRWINSMQPKFTMESALRVVTGVKCKVVKDKVYGILGLIPNSRITPAYGDDTSLEEVAVTVMKDCVNNLKEMDLLHLRGPKLEEMGKCMVPSWESLVAPRSKDIDGSIVHDGNCIYDENVGLRVSNPRIFDAKIVAVIEPDRSSFIVEGNFHPRTVFKALNEKLHDDELVEFIRGVLVALAHPQYREESTAKEYLKILAEMVSFPSHIRAWDVLQHKYRWSKEVFVHFERLWLCINYIGMHKTYILGISKDNNCPHPCCKCTYIFAFQSDALVEDNLKVLDYWGHISDALVQPGGRTSEDTRVPVLVVKPMQEEAMQGVKFISASILDGGIRHESKAFEIDAITVV